LEHSYTGYTKRPTHCVALLLADENAIGEPHVEIGRDIAAVTVRPSFLILLVGRVLLRPFRRYVEKHLLKCRSQGCGLPAEHRNALVTIRLERRIGSMVKCEIDSTPNPFAHSK
jgi:hypothetical protein